MTDTRAQSESPDWDRVHFDVPCPACGSRFNGAAEPICPTCHAAFRWDVILPVDKLQCEKCAYQLFGLREPRCPECGVPFDWPDAVAAARTRGDPLFEFLWFDHPLSGLLRSAGLALFHPRRLWSRYALHVPPKVGPLLLFLLVQGLLFERGWAMTAWCVGPAMNWLSGVLGSPIRFIYPFRGGPRLMAFVALASIASFLAMQLLFQTKRRLGVRWTHMLRVFVHATVFASLATMGWCVLEAVLDATLWISPMLGQASRNSYPMLGRGVYRFTLLATWLYLAVGLRRHLNMPHARAASAAALLVGHVVAALIVI